MHGKIELFMHLEPDIPKLTHQHGIAPVHAGGKTFMHKTRELQNLEAKYVSLLKPHAPSKPWDCPTHLTTAWYFRRPKNAKGLWKTTKPDTDNLIKTLKDCMKMAGFFEDDALVCVDVVAKYWSDKQHGIHIRMEELEDK